MTTTFKRFILASAGILLVVVVLFLLASSGDGGYRAFARVTAKPFTNTVFAPAFEKQVIELLPGVIQVGASPILSRPGRNPGPGAPVTTNRVMIFILASGPTAEEAQRVANEAAARVCDTVLTNYGVKGEVLDRANHARPYSFLKDRLAPSVRRLFKP